MTKYAHIVNKKIMGWYDSEIHSEIPTPNVNVSDEIWQEAININANCYENGEFIVKDFRTEEELEAQAQAASKVARTEALANLTVEVNGHVFDANETARTNMMAAILSADLIGKTEESWKLADNSVVVVTLVQLKEALAKAIQAVGEIVRGE